MNMTEKNHKEKVMMTCHDISERYGEALRKLAEDEHDDLFDELDDNVRYMTPIQSLEESLKEMKLIRQGKKKGTTWDELVDELEENVDIIIHPKLKKGKLLLDRNNPKHRDFYED